jgi:predicted AAA+ superfamily ATPase
MGLYAENLVFNALRKWRGTVALDYYRDRTGEVDFVVHVRPQQYLPMEVKHRDSLQESDLRPIRNFIRRFQSWRGLVVTKERRDFGSLGDDLFLVPLLHFLLLFD